MNVDFITAIKLFFANYANFTGRSTRAEYWWAMLFLFIVSIVTGLIPFLSILVSLALVIPQYAILTRRLHDTNHSGWWVIATFVLEIIGVLLMIMSFGDGFSGFIEVYSDPDNLVAAWQNINGAMFGIATALMFVPCIVVFIFTLMPSGADNQYGPNPYGEA